MTTTVAKADLRQIVKELRRLILMTLLVMVVSIAFALKKQYNADQRAYSDCRTAQESRSASADRLRQDARSWAAEASNWHAAAAIRRKDGDLDVARTYDRNAKVHDATEQLTLEQADAFDELAARPCRRASLRP